MEQKNNIISAIIYTAVDDQLGPNPLYHYPSDLSDEIIIPVSIKTITILSGEQGMIPKSLLIIPFTSLNMKGIIKYLEWKDKNRRGNIGNSAITMLFDEEDDVIFYRYYQELNEVFGRYARKIELIEKEKGNKKAIIKEINSLSKTVESILEELKHREEKKYKPIKFPPKRPDIAEVYQYKIVICGNPMVGKTSLVVRYTEKAFTRSYLPTLGVSVSSKLLPLEDIIIQLVIWDVAGQSKFKTMRTAFYKGARGVILMFDVTNRKSFKDIEDWHQDICKYIESNHEFRGLLIGNKIDRHRNRVITREEALSLANRLGFDYIETSALTSENVRDAFLQMAEGLYKTNGL